MATQIATGLTLSDDGLTLNVDQNYTGTGVNLNDLPTVRNVDASTAPTNWQEGFTVYGNSLDNNLIGSYTNYNIMAGGAGNDTLRATNGYSDIFVYDGQGNDLFASFTPNLDGDRLILGTPVSSVTRSGSNYIISTPTGNTLTLATTFNSDTNMIYVSADGGNSYFSAQISDVASTITTYMEADYTAMSQPGTLYVYSYPAQVFYFDDGEPFTIGGGQEIYLDGSAGKTFINVCNVDASNSLGDDVIFGDAKANVIIDGAGNNVLWGGADTADDVLQGGMGADVFFLGKGNGDDVVLNASSADLVNLFDTTLFDIVGTFEANGMISLTFNTGATVTVQSTENLSAAFQLADGSAFRFNNSTKSWQTA